MTPPSPPPPKSMNPYPHNTRRSTIEGPHPVFSGASKVHSFLPLAVPSAASVPASVPTNATPATAETGAKTFPLKSSDVQRILPFAGSSVKTLETLVGVLDLGSPTSKT